MGPRAQPSNSRGEEESKAAGKRLDNEASGGAGFVVWAARFWDEGVRVWVSG